MPDADSELALLGGKPAVTMDAGDLFAWPIVTEEDERAVLEVLRRGAMSESDVTKQFEQEFGEWIGLEHVLGCCNGTAAIVEAMWACGVGAGDEVICPSMTYWASAIPALTLGAAVNFTEIDPDSLCIDPGDIKHRICPRTKAIVVVHQCGYPCDMDPIMQIARDHGVKVIEDVSHAQGGLYKGRMLGTIGDVGVMSMMSGKSLAAGEAGIVATNDRAIYERCTAFGHYGRTGWTTRYADPQTEISDKDLLRYAGVPIGGVKHRMNQLCSAMGRVQLKSYDKRIAEIQSGMNRFWDLLEDVPGIVAHRPAKDSGSTMGGWYNPRGLFRGEQLGGLSCAKFCEAVRAEGVEMCWPGANFPLHTHALFHTGDLFRTGKPTMTAWTERDVRQGPGSLPVSERIHEIAYGIPWFKHDRADQIAQYAAAYRKVAARAGELLEAGE